MVQYCQKGTSKNRFEKGKWVECAECDASKVFRGDQKNKAASSDYEVII